MAKKRKNIDMLCDYMRKLYEEYNRAFQQEPNADYKIKYQSKSNLLLHLLNEAKAIKHVNRG